MTAAATTATMTAAATSTVAPPVVQLNKWIPGRGGAPRRLHAATRRRRLCRKDRGVRAADGPRERHKHLGRHPAGSPRRGDVPHPAAAGDTTTPTATRDTPPTTAARDGDGGRANCGHTRGSGGGGGSAGARACVGAAGGRGREGDQPGLVFQRRERHVDEASARRVNGTKEAHRGAKKSQVQARQGRQRGSDRGASSGSPSREEEPTALAGHCRPDRRAFLKETAAR